MNVKRGDIVLADFPHATGTASKRRPVLIIQANYDNRRIHNIVVVLITGNLNNASDPAHHLIRLARQKSVVQDSAAIRSFCASTS
jgi:mRNA-degrading endonuclease toxin of MazEF toxin-antitoxin module